MPSTDWSNATVNSTEYGLQTDVLYNAADRTYNAAEFAATDRELYYIGLLPTELEAQGVINSTNYADPSTNSTNWT